MFFLIVLLILLVIYVLRKFSNYPKIHYHRMTRDDVEEIHSIEMSAYNTNDEVPGKFFKHNLIRDCPELCMVAKDEKGKIIGAMYSGLMDGPSISMDKINKGHNPDGDTLFVYSLCVINDMMGRGIGKEIANYYYHEWLDYGDRIKYASTSVRSRHIDWMKKLGFSYVGVSDINAGNERWFDVMKKIKQ
jgi:hypothetical protein